MRSLCGHCACICGRPNNRKVGTTPYVTHFVFRPIMSIDIPGLGTATNLEAVGTTQNMKRDKMLDKISARCAALSVASGEKKYIDGACVLADSDGNKIFSTFDTRDVDKSQPDRKCGTHIITGGTSKYKGIAGTEPFACINMSACRCKPMRARMRRVHNLKTGARPRHAVNTHRPRRWVVE